MEQLNTQNDNLRKNGTYAGVEPHPEIGLDVFHDVADVEIAVGIRQGGGNEELARAWHGAKLLSAEGNRWF